MPIKELDQEHRAATAEYLRSEQELSISAINPSADPDKLRLLIARRNAALKRLNSVREAALDFSLASNAL